MIKYLALLFLLPLFVSDFGLMKEAEETSSIFRNIEVEGQNGVYKIQGETKRGEFFYTVEDGHIQYIEEQKVTLKSKGKFKIEINIPKNELPKNATLILNLYEQDGDGKIVNSYPVVLQKFYE